MSATASNLPIWVEYARALGPLVVAISIGGLGALIAWRQWRTNETNLREKLFERRIEIFAQSHDFILKGVRSGTYSDFEVGEFSRVVNQSRFLFGQGIRNYLEEIRHAAVDVASASSQLSVQTVGVDRSALVHEKKEQGPLVD